MDCIPVFRKARKAAGSLIRMDENLIDRILLSLADNLERRSEEIISGNRRDLARMDSSDPKYDRLLLDESRIGAMAADLRSVASLKSPAGRVLSETIRPNGLKIRKISVPFGVVGVVYESRPNVTTDVFSLCLKSGNACVLKGGSDAIYSNRMLVGIIREVLTESGADGNIITLLPAGREELNQLLNARDFIDLVIPRGSSSLIDYVRENATIPVIETGAGICHTYFDESGDSQKGRAIVHNAKTRRVSVCNALDCLIINEKRLDDLGFIVEPCSGSDVIIYADRKALRALKGKYPARLLLPATKESFGTEFLSYRMTVKTVSSLEEALVHIAQYGSKHSEAIIAEDEENISVFHKMVDASSVYSNASTAFTDGAQFGLGAEIGISTQKLHARGPMGLEELTTYKWIIVGEGQTRS